MIAEREKEKPWLDKSIESFLKGDLRRSHGYPPPTSSIGRKRQEQLKAKAETEKEMKRREEEMKSQEEHRKREVENARLEKLRQKEQEEAEREVRRVQGGCGADDWSAGSGGEEEAG
eukprot:754774-Hanusia_phi.AAC.2